VESETGTERDGTVLKLIGRLEGDQLNELQEVLASEASALDLIKFTFLQNSRQCDLCFRVELADLI
jgi:hypothetical protein